MGLDYSYALAVAEELGNINCGAIPMAIGVQTDMATPALARYLLLIFVSIMFQVFNLQLLFVLFWD